MRDGLPWRERVKLAATRGTTLRRARGPVPMDHNPHKKRGVVPWDTPRMWEGATVCIVGGGPSLKPGGQGYDKLMCARPAPDVWPNTKWIGVNNAYEIAPWIDLLFFADCEWWKWNRNAVLRNFPEDKIIATATSDVRDVNGERIKRLWRDRNNWSEDPQKVHGWDGGTMCVNLAYHLGAAKIVLFGFDMQLGPKGESQWHTKHRRKTDAENYTLNFIPRLTKSVETLDKRGVLVVRCTDPGLSCIPLVTVADALSG